MTRTWMVLLLTAATAATSAPAEPAFQRTEDFSNVPDGNLPGGWEITGFTWEADDGRLLCEDAGKTFAICTAAPHGREVTVEATIIPRRALGNQWKIAGVCVYRDGKNYWHLALTESPTNTGQTPKRSFELVECHRGSWLANYEGDTALPRRGESVGGDARWGYGKAYRFRLALTGEGISGTVRDAAGTLLYKRSFRFPKGKPAVTAGRPALDSGDFRVHFDDVRVAVGKPVGPPASESPPPAPAWDREPMSDIRGKATGFFHVQRIDGTWWLIDPAGWAFYDVGTDHCRYTGHWCEKLGYAPYGRNMRKLFPDETDWCEQTVGRLTAWGFNCVAAGHSRSLRHRGLVHTEFISFGARFSTYSDITPKVHWTGFPNVFHPRWKDYCLTYARRYCRPQRGDPWLLGYFLDNELEWYGKSHRPYGLVEEAWAKPADHTAKAALVRLLKERRGTIEKLNRGWGTDFASFEALAASRTMPVTATDAANADRDAYLALIAERYFAGCCEAIRAADPNHMILGSRFAGGGVHDCVWEVAGRHLDVVTRNQYARIDLDAWSAEDAREDLVREHALCKRPMILTEWSFPALDSGLPCTKGAGMRVDTQAQRARAFEIYQTMLFAQPFMVGSHFFMWVDEPALGISSTFPENTNYGLVDEQGEPYDLLTAACRRVNPKAVAIHAGRTAEIAVRVVGEQRKAVLANAGKLPADVPLTLWLDGRATERTVTVPAGGSAAVGLGGEAGFAVVRADPERVLDEADRADNTARGHLRPAKAAPAGGALVCVGNPTDRDLRDVTVRLPLTALTDAARGVSADVPLQHVALDGNTEVSFLVAELPARSSVLIEARPSNRARPPAGEKLTAPFVLENPAIALRKTDDDGDLIDDVRMGAKPLGRVQALIHENTGQDLWLPANRLVEVRRSAGPVETVAEFTAEYRPGRPGEGKTAVDDEGQPAARRSRGRAYRARYRLRLPAAGRAAFELTCLSVTNIDTERWRLVQYFHYLPSHLGGSSAGDAPGAGDVPNYYGLQSIWYDAKARCGYGVVVPDALHGRFWLDPAGAQHPDVDRDIHEVLLPGETWTAPADEPAVHVFGVTGKLADRPWHAAAEDLEARQQVTVKAWR